MKAAKASKGCSYCGQQYPDLQRCGRCKREFYCSKVCQKKHWKEGHKESCNSQDVHANWCSFCGQQSEDLQRCSRCKEMSYCSRECQKQHWKAGHRKECKETVPKGCQQKDEESHCKMSKSPQAEKLNQAQKIADTEVAEVYQRQNNAVTTDITCDKKLDCCSSCGMNGELKTCTGCHVQKSCSVECQVADWKSHKPQCRKKEVNKSTTERSSKSDDDLPICAYCKVKNTSLVCEKCRLVFYCSKSCQIMDWETHKKACRRCGQKLNITETLSTELCRLYGLVTPEENNGIDRNDVHAHERDRGKLPKQQYLCYHCKTKPSILTCPDCQSTTYCSTHCMDLNSEIHKKICNALRESQRYEATSPNAYSFIFGSCSSDICLAPSHSPQSMFLDPLTVDDDADFSLVVERSVASCEKARERIRRRFPNHTLISRIREIPIEKTSLDASNICTLPFVFVSYIRRFHGYRGRHNVYLQDTERREIYVSFYIPNDDPSPYFRWSDVVPGKFIAILFPCIHFFNDGSVGLRVDKVTNVNIFDIKD